MLKKKEYVELSTFKNEITALQKQYVLLKTFRNEIDELKKEIAKKPSDDINEARQALKKCTEYKNRCADAENTINSMHSNVAKKSLDIKAEFEKIEQYKINISRINELSKDTENDIEKIQEKIALIDTLFEGKENLDSNIEDLTNIYNTGTDVSNKINAIYNGIKKKKDEIETLSYEIFGYEETDEENISSHVDGLKDELEQSYIAIEKDLEKLEKALTDLDSNTNSKYDQFLKSKEATYNSLVKDIEELLPRALTAGLSHAFSDKRESEIIEGNKLLKTFKSSIIGLVAISLIPFSVSIYLLISGNTLIEVINNMPRMVLSILPLYVPIVWLAYSSSKKINLSKRLVEEYTHKEVLSKTFEGLSKQIENIEDDDMSSELRVKLLYNILSVSSENPGKLISDYNTADHPLMDALDKSTKLSDAVESLSKIPGLSKLSKILEHKANEIQRVQDKKAKAGLEAVSVEN
jgi:conjugal transfer/entry exclusion protein